MANPNAPFGLRPVRYIDGTPWNGATIRCHISGDEANSVFIGDPVRLEDTASYIQTDCKCPTVRVSGISTTNVVFGVVVGFEPYPTNLTLQYGLTSTERYAHVCVAQPNLVFQIKDDGDGTPANTWIGANTLLAAGAGGSTITGVSSFCLDGSTTPTTTIGHQLHILNVSDIEGNTLADYAIWDVILNTCYNTGGIYLGVVPA